MILVCYLTIRGIFSVTLYTLYFHKKCRLILNKNLYNSQLPSF
nr:hypothetical protein QGKEIAJE_QGKEIAJE_CDS_0032 [uncultured phage]